MTPMQQNYARVLLGWAATLATLYIVQQFFSRL